MATLDPGKPVLVVGAGPGGSATAIALRRRGRRVVLLDRQRFPRDKVCGDVVLPEAQEAIRALGLPWEELRARGYACTGSRYVAPGGTEVHGMFRDGAGAQRLWWIIKREVLDHWLLEQARAAGAEVQEGHEGCSVIRDGNGVVAAVDVRRPGGTVERMEACAVVGADGATSSVARSVGLFNQHPDHLCLAARAYVHSPRMLPEPYLEIFTTERTLPGCAWILPVGDHEWNVGVGIIKADSERIGKGPAQLFDEVREQVPLFRERLAGLEVPRLKGWSLPGTSENRRIVDDGLLLVGDAGAMVDPFTGHGIHHALMAGGHAGDVLHDALAAGDVSRAALAEYDTRCRRSFLGEAALGQRLQRLHARATLMRAAVALCGAHPGMRWAFLALLGHAAPRHDVVGAAGILRALFTRGPAVRGAAGGADGAEVTA
ncbi:MAG: NAD(P)/FAD-dependent oxidoreductase [Deltaproteobacteria bacterium]|nr:NAD(P)/FAD-dependent oxidoreductase [Deltaproteobacteria bacterium]